MQESLANGAGPTQVARRYGISTALLYTWRKQLLSAATEGFVPCEVVDAGAPAALPAPPPVAKSSPGLIEVELPGGARLRIGGGADAAALKVVLDALAPAVMALPTGARVYLACGVTDMALAASTGWRRRCRPCSPTTRTMARSSFSAANAAT